MPVPDLDPLIARNSAEYVALLRRWKSLTGLTYREIERRARKAGDRLPASTLATVLGRTSLPRPEVIAALVRACGGDKSTVDRWVDAALRIGDETGPAAPPRPAPPVPSGTAPATVPRQLPGDIATFVGRAKTLEQLSTLVGQWDGSEPPPVVAIVGPGGVGKTALAVRWLHSIRSRFPGGQLFADLKGFSDGGPVGPAQVLHRFLRALGVEADRIPADAEERAALYRSVLADRDVAVVLDNVRDAAQVRPLLPGGSSCLAVVTSRGRLRGLSVSHDLHVVSLDALAHDEAMQLLVRLLGAQRVHSGLGAAEELAELCRSLPLALRLAAARLAAEPDRPLESLVSRLTRAGRLSTLAVRGDPATALRGAFDMSYAALGPEARRLLVLSGLHPGPDMSATGLAALAGAGVTATEDLLEELAALHLVRRSGDGRWRFHDLVREYVAHHIASDVDADGRRDALLRLLDWYLVAVKEAMRLISPGSHRDTGITTPVPVPELGDYPGAVAWLDTEYPAVIDLIRAAGAGGHTEHLFELAGTIWRYFLVRGHVDEWIAVQRPALAAARELGDLRWQSVFLNCLGNAHNTAGDLPASLDYYRQALVVARQWGDPLRVAYAGASLGVAYLDMARLDEAREQFERALTLFEEAGDADSAGGALHDLGRVEFRLGGYREAHEYARRSLDVFTECGERLGQGVALLDLGLSAWHLGDSAAAAGHLDRALAVCREIGFGVGTALGHSRSAMVAASRGDTAAADAHRRQASEQCRTIGDGSALAEVNNDIAHSLLTQGELGSATVYFRQALDLVGDSGDRFQWERARRGLTATGAEI